jgi:hypothetical protein
MEKCMLKNQRHEDETSHGICRREFIIKTTLPAFGVGLALMLDSHLSRAFAIPPCQERWAQCVNCAMLFFNGYENKGHCPAYGVPSKKSHIAEKRIHGSLKPYYIAYDDSTGPGQGDWRYCKKCKVLFFNGYPDKGVCARDGKGHEAAGYQFFLYHDRKPLIHEEANWRFCSKCYSLFYAGSANTSGCPRDGRGHQPAGYKFVVGQKQQCIDDCPRTQCR